MRKFTNFLMISLALLVVQVAIYGQTSGSLAGTVSDPNGAVLAGASISAKNTATGEERKATTNDRGFFSFDLITPGTYTLTVEASGFKKAVASNVTVSVSKETQIPITLEIGVASETVTVTTAQDTINTSSPTLTNVINTRQVVDLPLNGRNPVELAGLQAGIAVVGTDVRGSSVSGLRQTAVNLTQDGINAMDNFVKTSSLFALTTPSLNSTSEFSITTGTVGSDAGRGAAQVNIVTKGGSNEYHGGAFLQLINSWTNSNLFFNNYNNTLGPDGKPINNKPILRQHYDGFDIGGPVHFLNFGQGVPKHWSGKDKAFFFFSYERFVQSDSAARNRVVLSQNARNGLFQYNGTDGVNRTVNLLTLGTIPRPLNPFLSAHLALIPLPNNSTCAASDGFNIQCYLFNASQLTTNDKYVARYDHQLVKDTFLGSHKLEFVYSKVITKTFPDVTTNGLEAPFPGGVNGFQASNRNLITPSIVSTFGSHITNVFRYGRQFAPVEFSRESQPTQPFISLPGALTNYDNTFLPQPRNTVVNQVTDTLSWVKGNHLWKFGLDWQGVLGISRNDAGIIQTVQLGTNAANNTGFVQANLPSSSTTQLTNANTVYAAITGLLGSSSKTFNVSSPTSGFVDGATRLRLVKGNDTALFVQDQWRLSSNFTLNYGVRWDYMGVPTVPNGLAIQPKYADLYGVSGFGNLFKPTAAPGSSVTGPTAALNFVSGTTGIGLYKNDWNNFAPFVGFAWSPSFKSGVGHLLFGDEGKSSIRVGYSQSFLHDGVTTFTNLLGTGTTNAGLIQTANIGVAAGSPNLTGVLTSAFVPLVVPNYKIPITDRENILLNSTNGLWTADPNLKSAYVHQYNVGFEREIMRDTALEIRYVGNRAPNTWRVQDINEVNIFENGFLNEFKNAQINLTARGGTSFAPNSAASPCAACVALPILDRFFGLTTGGVAVAAGSAYSSATFIANLNANNVGTMASTLAFNTAYRTNRESAAVGLAANFFVANPNAAFARYLNNDSSSNYNALEVELRRRFSNGLQFQADYTWSKAMGDAVDNQGNNQSDLASRLTLRDARLDYRRSGQDQTQRFVSNGIYDLPFGKSRPFFNDANGVVDRVIGGWSVGVIATWATGVPFHVAAGRATFNSSTANNGAQLVGISLAEFKKNVGLYKTAAGVFFINPALLDITLGATGKATASRLKAGLLGAPAPGTFGNFPINSLTGPQYFDVDFSVTKRIPITERVRFEIKSTFINVLNHANFVYGTQNFDATTFGLITTQRGTTRQMNFIGQLRF